MIKIKYYATEREDLVFHLSHNDENPLSIKPLSEIEDKIKNSAPIFNFANFFGDGIDLCDETIELGDEGDYYGFIPQHTDSDQSVAISFSRYANQDAPWLDNGITIEFNKYTCRKITVERNGIVLGTAEASSDEYLSEKVHIAFVTPEENWEDVIITFSGFPEKVPINLKGVILGKVVDIDDVMSFDMITETNPISDDLALNEINITAVIKEDFTSYEGQKGIIYDNDEVLEDDILKSSEETDIDFYNLKLRNKLDATDKFEFNYASAHYNPPSAVGNWSKFKITVASAIADIKQQLNIDIFIPDNVTVGDENIEIGKMQLSQFMPKCSLRKLLQQIAWSCCCGIDTTYKDGIAFVPFFARNTTDPDITISNDDGRILKTSITKGESYSKIIWTKTKYFENAEATDLGEIELRYNPNTASFVGIVKKDEPFLISSDYAADSNNIYYWVDTPYISTVEYNTEDVYENFDPFTVAVKGYKYDKYDEIVEISTGIKNGGTLEISNQTLFPLDDSRKIAQLKKWYSRNNTLSATVVDNDSQIRLGKVIKIQLKKGDYFQGIITKVIRDNIGDYHTVDLEAHEWN